MPAPTSRLRSALAAGPSSLGAGSANVFGVRSFRSPVGPVRSGLTGFLFGVTLASAYGYYYLVNEYKGASTSMLESVKSLNTSASELSATMSRVGELENELRALQRDANTRATRAELARSDAYYKEAYAGLHDDIVELRARIANGLTSALPSSAVAEAQWRRRPLGEADVVTSSVVESFWPWSSSSSSSATNKKITPSALVDEKSAAAPVPEHKKNKFVTELNPTGIKPCCACPETKSARDECFLRHGGYDGEAAEEKCKDLVAAHRACMAKLGFKV
ncbi:hypothetical protein OC842_006035 [Tilletia horrida]|uniref:Uncharacterized protein n=1 Tax=Tilletia horrida TaxID=155126 RepID=A0AAN6G6A6_9BASI|nr:hypothetical protein OC842_006035 [Tilletia horrida]